jgi:hypothetical protein
MKLISSRATVIIQGLFLAQQGLVPLSLYLAYKAQWPGALVCFLLGTLAGALFWSRIVLLRKARVDETGLIHINESPVGNVLVSYKRLPLLRFPPIELKLSDGNGGTFSAFFLPSITENWLRAEPKVDVVLRQVLAGSNPQRPQA